MDFKDKYDLLDSMDYRDAMRLHEGFLFGAPVEFVKPPQLIQFIWSN